MGKKLEIPVGVITEKSVPGTEENVIVTASDTKTTISFHGFENEKEMLKEKSITGYMVRRTQSMEFHDLKYIQANGSKVYTMEDSDVEAGETYDYTITPCYKEGDNYFIGYNNGYYKVTIPLSVLAKSITPDEKIYEVAAGETKEISAKVEPRGTSITALKWSSDNELVAMVERTKKEQALEGRDYAIVTGKQAGVATITMTTTDDTKLSANTTIVVTPKKVKNIQTAIGTDSISLLWNTIDCVSGYYVYRQKEGSDNWEYITNVANNSYVDKNIAESTLYRYKVVGYCTYNNKDYEGKYSDVAVAISGGKNITTSQISVTGYSGEYDGQEHASLRLYGVKSSDKVVYSEDAISWSRYVPRVKNVSDSKVIYISITREGETFYFSVVANVFASSIENMDIHLVVDSGNWTGKQQEPKVETPTELSPANYIISYQGNLTDVGKHKVFVMGTGNYSGIKVLDYEIKIQKGKTYTKSGYKYKVTTNNKVMVVGVTSKQKTSITILDKVSLGGKNMMVTTIGDKAFQNCKKLKKVKIGKYVTAIGVNSFEGDKKLKSITITGNSLKKIGNSAWKDINKKAVFYVPKKKKNAYKKLLTKKTGYVSKMKIK